VLFSVRGADKYILQALFSVRHTNPDPINTNPNHNHKPHTENSLKQIQLSVYGDGKYKST